MHSRLTSHSYTTVSSAFQKLIEHLRTEPRSEIVFVTNAYNRVLAENVIAKANVPAYDTSHMDGFAVKAKEISRASHLEPVVLKIKSQFKPNDLTFTTTDNTKYGTFSSSNRLRRGEAFEISTGMYLPIGADTIIPIEQVTVMDDEIKVESRIRRGSFVYHKGKDVKYKEQILSKGHVLRSQDVALLASLGIREVLSFSKPKVAIIPTGSELTDDLKHVKPGQKFNTNSMLIAKLIEEAGGYPLDLGVTSDDVNAIRRKLASALHACDLVLTIAGTSVGKRDLVQAAISSLGTPGMIAHGIKLDRGRVTGVAVLKSKPIVALPGPVQGALNAFIVFAYPMIRFLCGMSEKKFGFRFYATLTKSWHAREGFSGFLKIVYVRLWYTKSGFKAQPLFAETESISLLSKTNGYIVVPEKVIKMIAGQRVKVHLIPGFSSINGQSV